MRRSWTIIATLLMLLALQPHQAAATAPDAEGRAPVSVALGDDYAPLCFKDDQGRPVGWLVDLWRLWSQKTGVPVDFVMAPFDQTLKLVARGKVAAHGGCFYNSKRARHLDYVAPLLHTTTSFFFHRDIYGIKSTADLLPYRVGVVRGDNAADWLREKVPGIDLVLFDNNQELFKAAKEGRIRVFVADTPVGLYFLDKLGIATQFRYYPEHPLYGDMYQVAVTKGDQALPQLIRRGLENISPHERAEIRNRWVGTPAEGGAEILTIACDRNYAPFTWLTPKGQPAGILIDLWRLWAAKTGARVEFVFGDWADTLRMVRSGEADIHSGLFATPERDKWLDYSLPLFPAEMAMFYSVARGRPELSRMKGMRIGILNGTDYGDWLAEIFPGALLARFADFDDMLPALARGDIDAVVDAGVTLEFARSALGLSGAVERLPGTLKVRQTFAGVPKGRDELLALVNKGLGLIDQGEVIEIERRWVADPELRGYRKLKSVFRLDERQKQWLKDHAAIRLGVDPQWMPFEAYPEGGAYEGISSSYIGLIDGRLGVRMRPVPGLDWQEVIELARRGGIDVLPCVTPTEQRSEFLTFTRPYIQFPNVIVTRVDAPYIAGIRDLEGKTVAVVGDYAVHEFIAKEHPQVKLLAVENIQEGFEAVLSRRAMAYIDNEAVIKFQIRKSGADELKIAASTTMVNKLAMGVRKDWPELVNILDAALASIPEETRSDIEQRWLNIRFRRQADWGFIVKAAATTLGFIAILTAAFVAWNRKLAREVAQRKRAEERFENLSANVPGAIFQFVPTPQGDWHFSYLNQRARDFFDEDPEVVVRENRLLNWHPEDRQRVIDEFGQSMNQGEDINVVGRIVGADGRVKWVRISGSPSRAADGSAVYNGFILDITDRKAAEQDYLASERKVKAMSQAVDDAMVMIDVEGRVMFWNPAAERLFGYSAEEAMGMDFHAMAAPEESRGKVAAGLAAFARSGDGTVVGGTTELMARNRRGEVFPVEVTISSFRFEQAWYAVGTVRDISRRKLGEQALAESEERSRSILRSAGEGIFGVDSLGRITFLNPAAAEMLGHAEQDLLGRPAHEAIHHHRPDGGEYPPRQCPIYRAHTTGQPARVDDEVLWRADGTSFPTEYAATPMHRDGRVVGAVITFSDVSLRKAAEREMRQNLEELERFTRLVVGREERMIMLKEEVNALLEAAGHARKYRVASQDDNHPDDLQ